MSELQHKKRRLCVVTGTRAEYGLLQPLMTSIKKSSQYDLQVVVFASHLLDAHGKTIDVIKRDGYHIDATVDMLLASNSNCGNAKSIGIGIIGLSDVFERLKPDLAIYLGDRFEGLCVANCCVLQRIPLAHIFGGDITEGAIDDAIRHSISKMANIHFPVCDESAVRLIQMGEDPSRVHMCGHPGLERFANEQYFLNQAELVPFLGFELPQHFIVCTFHPETAFDIDHSVDVLKKLLQALTVTIDEQKQSGKKIFLIFIASNADANSGKLMEIIQAYISTKDDSKLLLNLPRRAFVSLVRLSCCFCGNSSAGLLEVPALKVPTVNIGYRQNGRKGLESTINAGIGFETIRAGIANALCINADSIESCYEIQKTSELVLAALDHVSNFSSLLKKSFYMHHIK